MSIIYIPSLNHLENHHGKKKVVKISLTSRDISELKRKVKKKSKIKDQIVNNDIKKEREKSPDDTRFLGKKNQQFDRQTIAKNVDTFSKGGKGKENGGKVKNELKENKMALNDLGIKKVSDKAYGKFKQKTKLGSKQSDNHEIGIAANNDFIEDVPIGDTTHLNTIEFKYFGFYDRIRKKLEQYWGVNLKDKAKQMYKKGRGLVPGENYITSLKITLDEKGKILSVNVLSSSGQQALDSAAIDSFNSAGPFPNPPKGMIKSGKVTLEWGFVVKS